MREFSDLRAFVMTGQGYYHPLSFLGFYENSLRASTSQAYNPSQFQRHLFGYSLHVSQMQNLPQGTSQAYNNLPSQMQSPQEALHLPRPRLMKL